MKEHLNVFNNLTRIFLNDFRKKERHSRFIKDVKIKIPIKSR